MKKLIVYKSKTGFTERYAEWLSQELDCELKNVDWITIDYLFKYDLIIYGGSIQTGTINGLNFIKSDIEQLNGKKIIVFATGIKKSSEEYIAELKKANLPSNMPFFYMRGGLDENKISLPDKLLLKIIKRMIKSKDKRSEADQELIDIIGTSVDYTDKKYINPMLDYINKL